MFGCATLKNMNLARLTNELINWAGRVTLELSWILGPEFLKGKTKILGSKKFV